MPPPGSKKDPSQQAAVTPASVAAGLAAADSAQRLTALTQLATAAFYSNPQATAELISLGIPRKLVDLIQQQDKSAKLLACRQLATHAALTAAGPQHPLTAATASQLTVEALWSVLHAYAEAEPAIRAVLSDPAAVKAAATKKLPGAKDAVDPEEWLPGPSKFLLESALRALSSLATCTPPQPRAPPPPAAAAAASPAAAATAPAATAADPTESLQENSSAAKRQELWRWMAGQEAVVVVRLMLHPSGRVQMRALRLALQLAKSEAWCTACTAAGGVAAALQLAGVLNKSADSNSNSSSSLTYVVQLAALQLLMRMMHMSRDAAAAVTLLREQVLDGLMAVVLAAGSHVPPTTAAGSKGGKGVAEASKQGSAGGRNTAVLVQQAAAELLALLCSTDSRTCQLLIDRGGLAAFTALLPDPPPPPPPAVTDSDATAQEPQQLQAAAESASKAAAVALSADENKSGASASAAAGGGTAVPPLALGATAVPVTTTPPAADSQNPNGSGISRPATPSQPAAATTTCGYYSAAPGAKLLNPQLQARLLRVVAAVLSQPGSVSTVLPVCPRLPRLLLHVFADRPVSVQSTTAAPGPSAGSSSSGGIGGPDTAATTTTSAQAAAAAGAGGGAGKSAVQTPRGSGVAVGVIKAPAPAAAAAAATTGLSASGSGAATTPRKAPATAATGGGGGATATPGKAGDQAAATLLPDALVPPYAACTKAAALACLEHIAHDRQGAALLAAHVVTVVGVSCCQPQPADTPAQTHRSNTPRQGQQQQQQPQTPQAAVSTGASMLRQVVADIQAMMMSGGAVPPSPAGAAAADTSKPASVNSSSSNSSGGEGVGGGLPVQGEAMMMAAQQQQGQQQQQLLLPSTLDSAAGFLEGLVASLGQEQLLQLPMVPALQALAKCAVQHPRPQHLQQAVMRALLALPEDAFVPPPRPPLPSPPPTPPPPPLPTSFFAWDALDRPCVTDGAVVVSTHA